MIDIYEMLAKRADQGKVEVHPIPVIIAIIAESEDEAHELASHLGGSTQKHPTGDYLVRVSDRAAAELAELISPRIENESQVRLLNELRDMWKEIDGTT